MRGCALIVAATCSAAMAGPVLIGDFGPNAVTESFEGLTAGPNIPVFDGNPAILQPGFNSVYTFGTGLKLVDPIPNVLNTGVFVYDYSLGSPPNFFLAGNGTVDDPGDLPDGTAYVARGSASSSITFEFPQTVVRAAAFITGAFGSITVQVLDIDANLLEAVSGATVHVDSWGTNLIGIENLGGFERIRIAGNFEVVDAVMWDIPAAPVPITTLGLMGMLAGFRRRPR